MASRPRRRLFTSQERLAGAFRALDRPDPLFPLVIYAIERGLQRASRNRELRAPTELDQAFDEAAVIARRRRRRVPTQLLERLVRDYHALPDELLERTIPPRLMKLEPGQTLEISDVIELVEGALDVASLPPGLGSFTIDETPVVNKFLPEKASYDPGETVKLMGSHLNPSKATVRVQLTFTSGFDEKIVHLPASINSNSPSFTLPADLTPGVTYTLTVERTTKDGKTLRSNDKLLHMRELEPLPEVPQPAIEEMSPAGRRPGEKILLTGANLLPANAIFADTSRILIEPMDAGDTPPSGSVQFQPLNPTQLEVFLPVDLKPGLYRFAIVNAGGFQLSGVKTSEWVTYEVLPHRYSVNFLTMHCIDESDTNLFFGMTEKGGDDELVTAWAVAVDGERIAKVTGEYTGFFDGETKSYSFADGTVYSREIETGIVIATQLHEWDAGDIQGANEAVKFVADAAGSLAKMLATSAPKAAAILAGVALLSPVLQKLITYFGGEGNFLGEQGLAFEVGELQKATQNGGKIAGELDYLNPDITGSYRLTYEVVRTT